MRRTITMLLILSLIFSGAVVFAPTAEAAPNNVFRLDYTEIERLVRRNNPVVINNEISMQGLNEVVSDGMFDALFASQSQLVALQASTQGVLNQIMNQIAIGEGDPHDPITRGIVMSLQNDIAATQRDIMQISAQMDQVTNNVTHTQVSRTRMQINAANRQITWGAESLFMGYHALTRQIQQSSENLDALNRNIEVMERRQSLGQVTARQVQTLRGNRTQLEAGIRSMESELENLKSQLNLLIGRNSETPIQIGRMPAADRDFLDGIDRARDLTAATRSNHLINIAIFDIEEHSRQFGEAARRQEEIARNNYESEVRATRQRQDSLIRAIVDREAALELAEEQLEMLEETLEEQERRFRRGMISRVELEQAQSEIRLQRIRIRTADADLFGAIQRYEWFLRGLSV